MPVVDVEKRGTVAVLWMNNPPVNALGAELREKIADALLHAASAPDIGAIVLASRHRMFSGGADIKEFGARLAAPTLRDLIGMLDDGSKPVVAAIDGVALGGGLELALACDARVVTQAARLGLPESNLGLIPGAGGTQRLPRLIGAAEALRMMGDAKPLAAKDALGLGLADQIVETDVLIDMAVALAESLVPFGRIRVRDLPVDARASGAFEIAGAKLIKSRSGEPQIEALVNSVRATFRTDFDAGLKIERSHFETLLVDERSRALRHIFFAERQASSRPQSSGSTAPRAIDKVGVVGGGMMGTGIAMAFASGGIPVVLSETSAEAAEQSVARIRASYDRSVLKGSLTQAARDEIMTRITPAPDLDSLRDVDLVVEAAFEDIDVKRDIFTALSAATRGTTILATNTSYLDVDLVAEVVPDRCVVGMHFFSPANVMRLVEVVKGAGTSEETVATVVAVVKGIGKLPVVVGNCHGFVGNRMLARRSEQVDRLLLEGATPKEIDTASTDFGFKLGPCAVSDLAGLDISWRMRRATGLVAPAADALVEAGRLGQKSGSGYYLYGEDRRTPSTDPQVVGIIEDVARKLGFKRRKVHGDEIMDRLLLSMVNEAACILDEGVAARPSDIDVIWVHGYGFPRHRGGPMFYAETRGYADMVSRLRELAEMTGDESLLPSRALKELADAQTAAG